MKTPGYLRRLLGLMLLVGLLPVAMLGLFSYMKSSSDMQQKVNEANMEVLRQTQMTVEQALRTLQHASLRFANAPSIQTVLEQELSPFDFRLVNNIQTELTALSGIGLNVSSPTLISVSRGWTIGPNGLRPSDEALTDQDLHALLSMPKNSFWITRNEPGWENGRIRLAVKIPFDDPIPKGLLLLSVPVEEFDKLVSRSRGIGQFLLMDEQFGVVAADDASLPRGERPTFLPVNPLNDQKINEGLLKAEVSGDPSAISYILSPYNNWTYMSIASIHAITSESRIIGWVTLVMCLVAMLIAGLISFMGAFRMYRPVRHLYELAARVAGKGENAVRTSDEFLFIGERIQKLRTNEYELTEQLNRQVEPLSELFVLKLLRGELRLTEIREQLELFGYEAAWARICVLAVQIDTLDGTGYEPKDRDLMLFAIKNILNELIPAERRLRVIVSGQTVYAVLGGNKATEEAFKEAVYGYADTYQQAAKSYLRLKTSVGISRTYGQIRDLPKAAQESMDALKYRIKLGHESILFLQDLETEPGQAAYPEALETKLLDAIKQTDLEEAYLTLDLWLEETFRSEMRIDECQLYMVRLLTQIIRVAQQSGVTSHHLMFDSKSIINRLFEFSSKEAVHDWFRLTVIEPIIALVDERRGEKMRNISDTVIDMIHQEFDTDITLENCAARLHFHPSYLYRVLRKEKGVNFSEYLAQYRLKMAKYWLDKTDMTIAAIAEQLRYTNTQNFIRYFKKMEGVSPGKYRENLRESDS
jgi:two-component system response regulator YesN